MAQAMSVPPNVRRVRSFVRRMGRITRAQQVALETLWPRFGLEAMSRPLDFGAAFGRTGPVVVEIGFGNGEHLIARAASEPASDFVGIDVHEPGVGHALREIDSQGLSNVRLICADAADVLLYSILPASVHEFVVYFPDPWPKKRHHKRRLIQSDFAALMVRALVPGGRLRLATDWADYAAQMRAVLDATSGLVNASADGFCLRPEDRPLTRFERRGQRLGHDVFDLLYQRRSS